MMLDPTSLPAPAPVSPDGMGPVQRNQPGADASTAVDPSNKNPLVKGPADKNARSFSDALSDDGGREALARLSNLAGRGQSAVKQSPALAFVTGQLEELAPQDIPGLVSTNPFINVALSSDIVSFMQTPMPMGEILGALGLDGAFGAKAAALGIDLNESVTPKDLLKSLGIDPQRVVAELSLLKQNLPFAGLAPYMQRAASLRGQKKAETADIGATPDSGKKGKNQNPMLEMAGAAGMMSPAAMMAAQDPITVGGGEQPISARGMTAPNGVMPGAATGSAAQTNSNPNPMQGQVPPTVQMPQPGKTSGPSRTSAGAAGFSGISNVAGDPFADLGKQMPLGDKTLQFNGAGLDSQGANRTLDALIAKQLGLAGPTEDAFAPQGITTTVNVAPNPLEEMAKPDLSSIGRTSVNPMAWAEEAEPEALISKDAFPSIAPKNLMNGAVGLMGSSSVTPATGFDGQAFSQAGDDESDQGKEEGSRDGAVGHLASQLHNTKVSPEHGAFQIHSAPGEAVVDRNAAVQKLLDASQMAVGQNGKSVRIDLGTHESGPMNVALRVDNGTVDLRVLTDSKEARNILAQELPRLRDSLAQQNLSLGKVEVGVDSGWSRSFQQNDGHRWNNPFQNQANWSGQDQNRSQNFAENFSRPTTGSRSPGAIIPQISRYGQFGGAPSVIRDGGRIQVAV